jgi:hypothetical protein
MITMTETQRLIARARLLRREGKTYDEIRAVIGHVSDDRLQTWLVGIPRPPGTRRSHPKLATRRRARQLRVKGATYDEIAAQLSVSKASLSLWLRDLPVPERVVRRRAEHLRRIRGHGGGSQRKEAQARMAARRDRAQGLVGRLSERELFIAGVVIYWCEGAKDKPWKRHGRVKVINSDPDLLRVYLAWLDLIGVEEMERTYALSIHEDADVAAHEAWWRRELGLAPTQFRKAMLKRHNPKPRRYNTGADYHGCLVVSVCRSAALYDAIAGWWGGVVGGSVEPPSAHPGADILVQVDPGSSKGRTVDFDSTNRGSNPRPGADGRCSNPWLPSRWWDGDAPVGSLVLPTADDAER